MDTQQNNVRSDADHRYLVISIGKSGSNWLNNMLAGLPQIERFDMGRHAITGTRVEELDLLTPGSAMYCHLIMSKALWHSIERMNIRAFYIYRELRDALVSEFFHKTQLDPARYAVELEGVTRENAFDLDKIKRWSTIIPYYYDVENWLRQTRIPVCRFEDLVADPVSELRRMLSHYGMAATDAELRAAVSMASFERMSGGRKPGQENPAHHYRKGIVGDWRNHFTEVQARALEREYGDILRKAGYETEAKGVVELALRFLRKCGRLHVR